MAARTYDSALHILFAVARRAAAALGGRGGGGGHAAEVSPATPSRRETPRKLRHEFSWMRPARPGAGLDSGHGEEGGDGDGDGGDGGGGGLAAAKAAATAAKAAKVDPWRAGGLHEHALLERQHRTEHELRSVHLKLDALLAMLHTGGARRDAGGGERGDGGERGGGGGGEGELRSVVRAGLAARSAPLRPLAPAVAAHHPGHRVTTQLSPLRLGRPQTPSSPPDDTSSVPLGAPPTVQGILPSADHREIHVRPQTAPMGL